MVDLINTINNGANNGRDNNGRDDNNINRYKKHHNGRDKLMVLIGISRGIIMVRIMGNPFMG